MNNIIQTILIKFNRARKVVVKNNDIIISTLSFDEISERLEFILSEENNAIINIDKNNIESLAYSGYLEVICIDIENWGEINNLIQRLSDVFTYIKLNKDICVFIVYGNKGLLFEEFYCTMSIVHNNLPNDCNISFGFDLLDISSSRIKIFILLADY